MTTLPTSRRLASSAPAALRKCGSPWCRAATVDPATLVAWCRSADIPVDRVVTVAAIPRNALGKINRETLKRELTG